jgi:hypothetical protein
MIFGSEKFEQGEKMLFLLIEQEKKIKKYVDSKIIEKIRKRKLKTPILSF